MTLHDYFFFAGTGVFVVFSAIVMIRMNTAAEILVELRRDSGRVAEALEKIEAKLPSQG